MRIIEVPRTYTPLADLKKVMFLIMVGYGILKYFHVKQGWRDSMQYV